MRKKRIAIVLAIALIMAITPTSAFAAEDPIDVTGNDTTGTVSGNSEALPTLNKDVFKVRVSTISAVDFIIDPQGLLHEADATAYPEEGGQVYFGNGQTSKPLSFTNLSSISANVELKVSATTVSGNDTSGNNISLAASEEELETATTPSVYLAVSVSNNDVTGNDAVKAVFSETKEATVTESLERVPEVSENNPGYQLKVSDDVPDTGVDYVTVQTDQTDESTKKYLSYELNKSIDEVIEAGVTDSVTYVLSGKCNSVEGWSNLYEEAKVTPKIVWKVSKGSAVTETGFTSGITDGKYSKASNEDIVVSVAMGDHTTIHDAGINVEGVTYSVNGIFGTTKLSSQNLSIDNDKHTFTISANLMTLIDAGKEVTVYIFFDNDDTQSQKLSFTAVE